MYRLIDLSINDFKLIFRDKSLRTFLAMPILIFAIILLILPYMMEKYPGMENYVPLVLMGAIMQNSIMFGFIYSMVLIHEKDIHIAKVYGVLPVSKTGFVLSRLAIPSIISTILTFLLLVVQPMYNLSVIPMLLLSVICGLMAPVLTLSVSVLSRNKMEGMTWFKLANLLVSVPLAAFLIPGYPELFGVIPSYWPFRILNDMILSEVAIEYVFVGLFYMLLILWLLIRRFVIVHFK